MGRWLRSAQHARIRTGELQDATRELPECEREVGGGRRGDRLGGKQPALRHVVDLDRDVERIAGARKDAARRRGPDAGLLREADDVVLRELRAFIEGK